MEQFTKQFTVLPDAEIVWENHKNQTTLIQWKEMGLLPVEYVFCRFEVVHVSRLAQPRMQIAVLSESYMQALRDLAVRTDEIVDF